MVSWPSVRKTTMELGRHACIWLVCGALCAGFPIKVGAQSAEGEHDDEARALFHAGEAAFSAGRFEDALGYFQRSYDLSQRTALLFNIGQAADRSRHDDVALDAFRRYLAANSDVPNRTEIEGRIRVLEAAVARSTAAPPPETEPAPGAESPAPSETHEVAAVREPELVGSPSRSGPDVGGIVLVSVGGVLAVTGAILFAIGLPDTNAVSMPRFGESFDEAQARQDTGVALAASGGAGLGIGIGLAIAGVIVVTTSGSTDGPVRATRDGLLVTF